MKVGSRAMKRWMRPTGLGCAIVGALALPAAADPLAVVELFTSQGCSSCPPADAALTRLAADDDYVALAFHVDYWDYLGWADTVSIEAAAARQQAYADGRGDDAIYTPQAVINGRVHVVGSDEGGIREVAAGFTEADALRVPVALSADAERVSVEVGAGAAGAEPATIWLATYTRRLPVEIERGENAGRNVSYANVVRTLHPVGMWSGEAVSIELPSEGLVPADADGCAVLVQVMNGDEPGAILGAAIAEIEGR
jgi:hypothetical protein